MVNGWWEIMYIDWRDLFVWKLWVDLMGFDVGGCDGGVGILDGVVIIFLEEVGGLM